MGQKASLRFSNRSLAHPNRSTRVITGSQTPEAEMHNRDVFCPFHGKGLTLQSLNIIML